MLHAILHRQLQSGSIHHCQGTLAYATDLCHGLDPAFQRYYQRTMRQHYVQCQENKNITPCISKHWQACSFLSWNKNHLFSKFAEGINSWMIKRNMFKQYTVNVLCCNCYGPDCVFITQWATSLKEGGSTINAAKVTEIIFIWIKFFT